MPKSFYIHRSKLKALETNGSCYAHISLSTEGRNNANKLVEVEVKSQWVGLTSNLVTQIGIENQSLHSVAQAIEAALKNLNGFKENNNESTTASRSTKI